MNTTTIDYYNQNAKQYYKSTVSLDFSDNRDRFLKYLPAAGHILDFGCGSGRDTKAFLKKDFLVTAIDGSKEMCKLATKYTGITVHQMLFHELSAVSEYDGIWACCSVLHLPLNELQDVTRKMTTALKPGGVIYVPFKHRVFSGVRNRRYYTDMTEEVLTAFIDTIEGLDIKETWITQDGIPGREDEKWLNAILQKDR